MNYSATSKCVVTTATVMLIFCAGLCAQPNTLDPTFHTGAGFSSGFATGIPCVTKAIVQQPDGKLLVSGVFKTFDGVSRSGIARLNSDGTLDPTFDPGTGFLSGSIPGGASDIKLQADGKLLVINGGDEYNGVPCKAMVRLNGNGTLDPSFDLQLTGSLPSKFLLQPDGKIIVGRSRLNSDGSVDPTYNGVFESTALQADGKVLCISGNSIKRLNNDGSQDNSLIIPGIGFNNGISAIAAQADGKIVIAGSFTSFNGVARKRFARLNNDGTLDPSYETIYTSNVNNFAPYLIYLQPDGKLIVGSNAALYRLQPDGHFDPSFNTPSINGGVWAICHQADGKIVAGGDFSAINAVTTGPIARFGYVATGIQGAPEKPAFYSYPNPSTGVINIELPEMPQAKMTLSIFDGSGRTLRQISVQSKQTRISLDITDGVYWMRLSGKGGAGRTYPLRIVH